MDKAKKKKIYIIISIVVGILAILIVLVGFLIKNSLSKRKGRRPVPTKVVEPVAPKVADDEESVDEDSEVATGEDEADAPDESVEASNEPTSEKVGSKELRAAYRKLRQTMKGNPTSKAEIDKRIKALEEFTQKYSGNADDDYYQKAKDYIKNLEMMKMMY